MLAFDPVAGCNEVRMLPVTIENDQLRLDVWPQFGGKISSIIDKADGYELLFSYPAELPTRCQYGMAHVDGWFAGWDECFPTVDPGPYPRHPYEGIAVPDHGEIWPLPTTAVPTRDGITTVWTGLRFGYRLTRKLYLDGPKIVAEYTLVNLAPFPFYFVWMPHALLSTASPLSIELGPVEMLGDGVEQVWPQVAESLTFTQSNALPAGGIWKRFGVRAIQAPAIVGYSQRSRQLSISYGSDSKVPAYWTVWLNTGGSAGQTNAAVTPTIGRGPTVASAVEEDAAGIIGPNDKLSWTFTLEVAPITATPAK